MNTSGPNPWFWAQNDRFRPDVVTVGVNLSQKNQNKNDNIWPNFSQNNQNITSGPNPGSGPEKLGLADVVVFFGCFKLDG